MNTWTTKHKNYLWFISSIGLAQFSSSIIFALMPVVVAAAYGYWYAGVIISIFGAIQTFLFDPIAGSIADKIGSRRTVLIGLAFGICAAGFWLVFSVNHLWSLLIFFLLLSLNYGFRATSETYILKISRKNEGGTLFGIFGNVSSLATFSATVLLPFFILSGHTIYAAINFMVIYIVCFIMLLFLPNDVVDKREQKKSVWSSLNPLPSIQRGWHFVHVNDGYPMLSLGAALFEGIFYGTIWFVFPLHLAAQGLKGFESGLNLGVYDLVTAFFAGYAGFLADKYNWIHTHALGWIFVVIGLIALPFYNWPIWLIIVGFVIAIGNNLSYYAAAHALEAHDIDHREDGSYIGLKAISNSLGYTIAPIAAGYLYSRYGFAVSLSVNSFVCAMIALIMIWFTWRLENSRH